MHQGDPSSLAKFLVRKAPTSAQESTERRTGFHLLTIRTQDFFTYSPWNAAISFSPSPESLSPAKPFTTPEPRVPPQKRPRRFCWHFPRPMEKQSGATPKPVPDYPGPER